MCKRGDSLVTAKKSPTFTCRGVGFYKMFNSNLAVLTAKVSIFSEKDAPSAEFFNFHSKREAIAHGRQATEPVLPLWAPN
jgi:hypothetical protein